MKMSFKEALELIDDSIAKGSNLHSLLKNEYFSINKSDSRYNQREHLKKHKDQHENWKQETINILLSIFSDLAPIEMFKHPIHKKREREFAGTRIAIRNLWAMFEDRMEVLYDFYTDLQRYVRSPLIYIKDKSQICYFTTIIQLDPETNLSELCRFMFDFNFGEWKEFSQVYIFITGENLELSYDWPKNWKQVVSNTVEGINKKTKADFGFNIFSIQKNMLALKPPGSKVVAQ